MYRIGIDVGSTYTKYCVMKDSVIDSLYMEKTPIRQKEYFDRKLRLLKEKYADAEIVSCGYGKRNISNVKNINELTALALGSYYITRRDGLVLDIGGQDTKIILQEHGCLKDFFINDKCAAGSGMFLLNMLDMLGFEFEKIDLLGMGEPSVKLSSVCAVFAQSEIVELIASNYTEQELMQAVIWQIFVKAKQLLTKVNEAPILLSGGLSQIKGIECFAECALRRNIEITKEGTFLAAIGCTCCEI